MEASIDAVRRIVIPKQLRDSLGLTPGAVVDVTVYGAGLQLLPTGRTARLTTVDGRLVAESSREVTDEDVFGLLDATRR